MNSSPHAASGLTAEPPSDGLYRILSLDGGGAKGFYTLGVLREIEAMINCPLYKRFDLVFGTSTGAIIAALIALGYEVDQIHNLYEEHVPSVTRARSAEAKSRALESLGTTVFGNKKFDAVKALASSQRDGSSRSR
jgi:predicted acylesterase/phospholipase RssA